MSCPIIFEKMLGEWQISVPRILSRYPILFVRKGDELSATPYDEGKDLVCYYREQAQDLLTYEI